MLYLPLDLTPRAVFADNTYSGGLTTYVCSMLNKNSLAVKKCEANQKPQIQATKNSDIC